VGYTVSPVVGSVESKWAIQFPLLWEVWSLILYCVGYTVSPVLGSVESNTL
jgi:hypothetical protein